MNSVKAEFGLACPKCQKDDRLQVFALVLCDLAYDGTTPADGLDLDHEWGGESPCNCKACGWRGLVKDAKEKA